MPAHIEAADREFLKQFMHQIVLASKRRARMQSPIKLPIVRRFSPIRLPSPPRPPIEMPKKK